jgi:C-terminal processing protease CtpA/Prc
MKHMPIHRMGTAALFVLSAALLVSDANAALRRSSTFGLSIGDLIPDDIMDLNTDFGVRVLDVSRYGPAGKAGIKAGDVIVKVDGKKVREPEDLTEILSKKDESDKVEIVLIRKGSKETVKAEPAGRGSEIRLNGPVQELPEETRGFDIQVEFDEDIQVKMKAEMEKLVKDQNSISKIEDLNGVNSKL